MFSWFPRKSHGGLFFVGVLPGFTVLFIGRNVEESEIYLASKQAEKAGGHKSVLLDIFKPPLLRSTAVASLLAAGTLGGNYTILTWLPTYMRTVQNSKVLSTGSVLGVNIFGSFLGYVINAHLSDWLGRGGRLRCAPSARR